MGIKNKMLRVIAAVFGLMTATQALELSAEGELATIVENENENMAYTMDKDDDDDDDGFKGLKLNQERRNRRSLRAQRRAQRMARRHRRRTNKRRNGTRRGGQIPSAWFGNGYGY